MGVLQKKPNLPIPNGTGACRSLLIRHVDDLRRFRDEEWSYESIHRAFLECYGEVFAMYLQVFRERARRVLKKRTEKEVFLPRQAQCARLRE
ncbi:hypothetical protein [Komagataeibacter rhaeticus]|uniref:Uncharacterized protein n=1 Tax=Komagataeibacter rhaeticus TaxID=215221 RepID=A0A858JNG0_9PROT|nr:hypothetical protein [Komagataeibacter rhaeticus]QIP35287.1 hypothetical protein GWK63_07245 [Komagataeibacter rhaeticus]QOC47850.1 hypothetical protein ICJ78_07300 [Komagataeibacter rhaeticus]WPP22773.1 hypothetical protein SCD25_04585 [Komagataeibacter rhaeticus]